MPKISAPMPRAIWTAEMPTPPAAAWISTLSPSAQAAHQDHGGVGRAVVDGERSRLLEAEPLRRRQHLVHGDDDLLGLAAEAGPGHHAVARLEVLHPAADGFDLPGDLVQPRTHGVSGASG